MDADNTPLLISRGSVWTRDKEDRLIALYSQFTLLWECCNPDYYCRDRREHAMRAIAAALNDEFDVRSVKEKIKSMRDYFVKELKKEHAAAQSSPPGRYVSSWEHFNAFHFLRRVIYSASAALQTVDMPQARSSPVEVDRKPKVPALSGQSGTLNPSVTSEADSNGVLAGTADARGQDYMGGGGRGENMNLFSEGTDNALFCGQLMLELRKMTDVQRDYAKVRFMQILFHTKYSAAL